MRFGRKWRNKDQKGCQNEFLHGRRYSARRRPLFRSSSPEELVQDAKPSFRFKPSNSMKYVPLPILAASWMLCAASARAEHEVHLRGPFNLAEWQGALLEVNHSVARSNGPPIFFPPMTRLVKPGEKFEDAVGIIASVYVCRLMFG